MLVRILLIVAIVASIGAIALAHFKVRPHIEGIIKERNDNKTGWDTELALRKKKESELKDARNELVEVKSRLEDTTIKLQSAESMAASEKRRADTAQANLNKTTAELKGTQQKLAAWEFLSPLTPDAVKGLQTQAKQLQVTVDALTEEKKVLAAARDKLQNQLDQLIDPKDDPIMKLTAQGKVVVVDPKWNFVVLDIGDKQGVVPRGVFMVSRNSKLVGKVRVSSTQGDRSIANVMPGWNLGAILEGDQLVY